MERFVCLLSGDDTLHSTEKLDRQIEILENDPGISMACLSFLQVRRTQCVLERGAVSASFPKPVQQLINNETI